MLGKSGLLFCIGGSRFLSVFIRTMRLKISFWSSVIGLIRTLIDNVLRCVCCLIKACLTTLVVLLVDGAGARVLSLLTLGKLLSSSVCIVPMAL